MSSETCYIGLSTGVHDPALAIVDSGGNVLFAEARERSSQGKRGYNLPPDGIHEIGPLLETYAAGADRIVVSTSWSGQALAKGRWVRRAAELWDGLLRARGQSSPDLAALRSLLYRMPESDSQSCLNLELRLSEGLPRGRPVLQRQSWDHHLCHAAAGCYASPFSEAVCAVVDGAGEHGATAFYHFSQGQLKRLDPTPGYFSYNPASLGNFYGDLCWACGFDTWKGEEWKVMGLAAYGALDPDLYAWLRPMLRVDGLRLRRSPDFPQRRERLRHFRGRPVMECADLAFTGQLVFTELLGELLHQLWQRLPCPDLVLCGGCALNSSANGKVLGQTPFQRLFVPSAPADDGNALGAAWLAQKADHPGLASSSAAPLSPYLGSTVPPQELERLDAFCPLPIQRLSPSDLVRQAASLLAAGKLLGWFQGRAEWGPRALGNRSILADPRRPEVHERLNAQVKFREAFRPFAPAILHEAGPNYFEDYAESFYMERTLRFRPERRHEVPGVVHVDGTGRLQTVRANANPLFHALLTEFQRLTGVPILLNTSLNVMGKPIVHSAGDALTVLLLSGLDALAIEDRLIQKQ